VTLIKSNLGLIGAQSSHARFFCEAFNRDKLHPGLSISYIYGADDPQAAGALRQEFGLELCDTEEELIAKSDAVAIVLRRGSAHFSPAMKVLEAKKPLFIDKPFTLSVEEANAIAETAKANKILLAGGSSLKALQGLKPVAQAILPGATVIVSYAADRKSEYDGYWFYGIHAVETLLALCGPGFTSVSAFRNGESVEAIVAYPDKCSVIMTSPDMADLRVTVLNDKTQSFNVPMDYHHVCPNEFAEMLKSGKAPRDYSFYVKSVELLKAIADAAEL
jgi:predicted dehydrogenase